MILGILQARMSSSRLPGKVLKIILGKPMLLWQIERIRRSKKIELLVVATSKDLTDDPLERLCIDNQIKYFRGSLEDVLERFYNAAKVLAPDHIVRLTGDCPLIDPIILDQVIAFHLKNGFDYTSNCLEPTFPDGLDVEVFRFSCLEEACKEATLPSHREHVTPFIYKNPRYSIGNFKNHEDLSKLRLTVDESEDFEVIKKIYETLYPQNPQFSTSEIIDFLNQNPNIQKINMKFSRNQGFLKSLLKDKSFMENQNDKNYFTKV